MHSATVPLPVTPMKRSLLRRKSFTHADSGRKGLSSARDRDHFSWPQGPGIFFGDYDAPATGHILTRDELLTTVYNVFPELQEPPHIWGTSASSCIFRTDTGEELRPISGQRLYIPVLDATDIVRLGNVLIQRFWLAGHGRYDVSKAGALLARNLLDSTMWQPERLDFIGGAHCGPGLEQRRPKPIIINPGKPFLDSRLIKDLTPSELEKLSKIQADAKNAKRPEVKQAQEEWISERLAGQKPEDEGRLRRILESAIRDKRLLGDFILHSAKHGKLTVGTILDNPAKFHGIRVADPLEPDYRNDKRIGYVNTRAAGKPYIWSWAHGGQRFSLHRAIETIRIQGGELPQIVKRALELMVLDGAVFDRGGELVRLADGRTYPITADWLQLYLTGLARFEIFDKRPQKWRQIDCPKELARAILSMPGLWELPRLEGLITAPTITPAGRVIDTDGFDEKTGLYLDLRDLSTWLSVPEHPSDDMVRDAVRRIWHPFKEFPFESPVDRGGCFAALLTITVRPLLPTAPAFCIPSPTAGSGKTLLARALSQMAGCDGEVLPHVQNDDEMRKRLLSLSRVCNPFIIFDNIDGDFESNSLSAYLTSERITDRILGASDMISGRTNTTVVITGNNPIVLGDLNRRLLRARINPACEKPYLRTFALDPVEYVREHRQEMIRDALIILKASILSGFEHDKGRLASFEAWSDFVRNAVVWIGRQGWLDISDPVEVIEQSYEADPETQRLNALLCVWNEAFGLVGATVAQAIRAAKNAEKNTDGNSELFPAMENVAGEKGAINPRTLGNWIGRHEGRIVDGLRFARFGKRQRAVIWISELSELREFSTSNAGNCQNDTCNKGLKITHETHLTHTCCRCVNFDPNGSGIENTPGICERPLGGRFPKMPDDGGDCPDFDQVTH